MRIAKVSSLALAIGVASFMLPPSSGLADTDSKPKLIKEAGQPIRLQFADGREAVLKKTVLAGIKIEVPFSINENTCNDKFGASCTYTVPMTNNYFFFAWSKNPDSSLLNQELSIAASANNSAQKIEFTSAVTSLQRSVYPTMPDVLAVENQSITCGDFDWFEANDPAHAGTRRVRAISTETTLPNAETRVDENRFYSTVRDIVLAPPIGKSATVSSATLPPGLENSVPLLFFGDSAWYVKTNSGDVCQFTARSQFAQAVSQFNSIDAKRLPPKDEKTIYIYGNATADKFYKIDSSINDLLGNSWENVK